MNEVDEIYAALTRGDAQVPGDPAVIDALLDRVFQAHHSPHVQERLAALRVAEAVGGQTGLDLVETFVQDPAIEVRRHAIRLGIAAREQGLRIVREAAHDQDLAIAAEALRLLARARDRDAIPTARTLLARDEVPIRAGAVRLLGQVAGPSMRQDVERLTEDPDATVRAAAKEAVARIDGRLPREEAGRWWEGAALDPLSSDASLPGDTLAPQGSLAPEGTLSPERGGYQNESTWSPEIDQHEPVWLSRSPDFGAAAPEGASSGPGISTPVPVPGELPTDPRDILRLLGLVAPEDFRTVVAALAAAEPQAVWRAIQTHRRGGDAARGRGIAIAARLLQERPWLAQVRQLVADPEPMVREAAYAALATLGGPPMLTQVSAGLTDEDPRVRAATVHTLTDACEVQGLLPILPNWLAQVAQDPSEQVREARAAALARIDEGKGGSDS